MGRNFVRIIADVHEEGSPVLFFLERIGAKIEIKHLDVADYVVSERIGIERKSAQDYVNSMFSLRLFDQAKRLSEAYEKPILIVEGNVFDYAKKKAILGSFSSLVLDYNIAVFHTADSEETAELIYLLAKRERESGIKLKIRSKPRMLTLREKQLFLVTGLPNINVKLAERLLHRFGTPRKVFMASRRELEKVSGIGEKISREIERVLDTLYVEAKKMDRYRNGKLF